MFKLVKIANNSYYFSGRLSVGCYISNNNKAVLIDSALEKKQAQQILKELSNKNITVAAIINTHSHADHCGGNHFFQKKINDLKIFSTRYEKALIEVPELEPIGFCCGASPFKALNNKFLQAKPSNVTDVISYDRDQFININGTKFHIIRLPGHTNGMIGIKTEDDVFYCGDAIFGNDTFAKHGVLFYTDIDKTIESMTKILSICDQFKSMVFYHGGVLNNPAKKLPEIINKHIDKLNTTSQFIYDQINKGICSIEQLVGCVIKQYNVPNNITQYALTETCVRSYITHLEKKGDVQLKMIDNKLTVEKNMAKKSSYKRESKIKMSQHENNNSENESKISSKAQLGNQILPSKNTVSFFNQNNNDQISNAINIIDETLDYIKEYSN